MTTEPIIENDGTVDTSQLREYEIALFKLNPGAATSYSVPKDAELWQITIVDNDAYAVFVIRSMTEEELALKNNREDFFENFGRNGNGGQ